MIHFKFQTDVEKNKKNVIERKIIIRFLPDEKIQNLYYEFNKNTGWQKVSKERGQCWEPGMYKTYEISQNDKHFNEDNGLIIF